MLAVIIINHPDAGGIGRHEEERLVAALRCNCGGEIADHAGALSQMKAFVGCEDFAEHVKFAFRPTPFSIAVCSRPYTKQLHIHLESQSEDIYALAKEVAPRVAQALPEGDIDISVKVRDDYGRDIGEVRRGNSVTFSGVLREKATEARLKSLAIQAVAAGVAATVVAGAPVGVISAVAVALLNVGDVLVCGVRDFRKNRCGIKWEAVT